MQGQVLRVDGDVPGLMTRPGTLAPVHRNPEWTVEAFAADLARRQRPVGVRRWRVEPA